MLFITAWAVLLLATASPSPEPATPPRVSAHPCGGTTNCFTMPARCYGNVEPIHVRSPAAVAARRADLIRFLWGGSGFPKRSALALAPAVVDFASCASCYRPTGANFLAADRLTIHTEVQPGRCRFQAHDADGHKQVTSVVIFYHPKKSNRRLAIFHQGHDDSMGNNGGSNVIEMLLSRGYSVLAFWMPLRGENERCNGDTAHERFADQNVGVPSGQITRVFLEPVAVALNYVRARRAALFDDLTDVTMIGISGGGWTTTLYAALDPTIRLSVPVSGTVPDPIYKAPCGGGIPDDFEQSSLINALYAVGGGTNKSDWFVMAATGAGRKMLQVLNQYDPCCHWGLGYRSYLAGIRSLVASLHGGEFETFLDQTTHGHEVTRLIADSILPHELDPPLFFQTLDFDGDRKADLVIFKPGSGDWSIRSSSDGMTHLTNWGEAGDQPVPADYDGDGKTDVAVFRPSDGSWRILLSSGATKTITGWGQPGDRPVPGNYTGDAGKKSSDVAFFRPADGKWSIQSLTGAISVITPPWANLAGDVPVPGDYDGDGKTDVAIFRPSDGGWYIAKSSGGAFTVTRFGSVIGDLPVPADYDGDGRTDLAFFRAADDLGVNRDPPLRGRWSIRRSSDGKTATVTGWGSLD